MAELSFTPLTSKYFSRYAALYRGNKGGERVHHRPELLRWAFIEHPSAESSIMELACFGDEVAGCLGAVPQTLIDAEGNMIRAGVLIDWLVDSRFRGKKVGLALAQRALARYPVAIGMGSTPVAYRMWHSLGLVDHGDKITARQVRHPWRWSRGARRGGRLARLGWTGWQTVKMLARRRMPSNGLEVEVVTAEQIDEELVSFSRRLAQGRVCTLRDAARWHWLVESCPAYSGKVLRVHQTGTIIGFAAVVVARRSGRLVGTVADLVAGGVDQVIPVVAGAAGWLAELGVDGITVTVSGEQGRAVVKRYGMEQIESPPISILVREELDYLLEQPWFMTGAENLSIVNGLDVVQEGLPLEAR
jgi:hypothetical protein